MLLNKIKEYLNEHTIQDLCNNTGINQSVFYGLIKRSWKKYNKNTLDILYDFFDLEKDNFYNENIKKWHMKTPSLFGTFIRFKRMELDLSIKHFTKKIKIDARAYARVESGDSLPCFTSYTIQHVMDELNFTEEEREITKDYIEVMKKLEKVVKKYDI